MQHTREWQRLHRLDPAVVITIMRSPIEGFLVRVSGWRFPQHFSILYPTVEAAQRASDDVLIGHRPHDCSKFDCEDWKPVPFDVIPFHASDQRPH